MSAAIDATQPIKIVIVGHVDHGKSTLVGRLLYETGAASEDQVRVIREACRKRGRKMEWAFLLDAFQAERDQGITIDIAQVFFRTANHPYVVIDAPGHKEFLKNVVTGAASADAAILIVDAVEGVQEQTRRHAYLLKLLGINQVAVVVTKMDLAEYDEERFLEIERGVSEYLIALGLDCSVIPVSAENGVNLIRRDGEMPWYAGPTFCEVLDGLSIAAKSHILPLRLPLQDVYKFDDRRIFVGRIETGSLRVGDAVSFSPSRKQAHVKSLEAWHVPARPVEAHIRQCVGFTLDEQIFVDRGEIVSHFPDQPTLTPVFRSTLFWLSEKPMRVGDAYKLRLNTAEHQVVVQGIEQVIDVETLAGRAGEQIAKNDIAKVILRAATMMALDDARRIPQTGRFVLEDGYRICGGGLISMEGYADQRPLLQTHGGNLQGPISRITPAARVQRNGHAGGVLWLTGLSGSGKSSLANEVERLLFLKGFQVFVLDGDNVRRGLSANLGFSPEDRAENIRRIGEVAALFKDAGTIVLVAFISPYRSDRERVRKVVGEHFHEIYVSTPLHVCEQRDPKGLYQRARKGEIPQFTGITAPYEPPDHPELNLDTSSLTLEDSVQQLLSYVLKHFTVTARSSGKPA